MSDTSNLAALTRGDSNKPRRRKPAMRSLLILFIFVLGTAVVFLLVFRDKLRPRLPVETGTVLLLESSNATTSGSGRNRAIAQASGWIEAAPFATQVPVKTDGYVESVEVLEGETVKAGQVVARLDPTDHLHKANILSNRLAEARSAEAVAHAAQELARTKVPIAAAELETTRAWIDESQDRLSRIEKLEQQDRSETERVIAEQEARRRVADFNSAKGKLSAAKATLAQYEAEYDAARRRSEVIQAELQFEELHLTRTTILSPIDGIVLKRDANPGDPVRALGEGSVITIYQPDKLQVRVDVPLSDINAIQPGQNTAISTGAFPSEKFAGTVTRIVGEADIARNTLQVKVEILNPHPRMRPEMLCRVEFLAESDTQRSSNTHQLWIPVDALRDRNEDQARVWLIDPISSKIADVSVVVGSSEREGLVPVFEGVHAGSKVVLNPAENLEAGSIVKGEER